MSILYSDEDGYFVSHERFISKLYEEILNNTENIVPFYEHFFHIHKPFFRDEQKIKTDTDNDGVKRKRKRQNVEENELCQTIKTFVSKLKNHSNLFSKPPSISSNNVCARNVSIKFYERTNVAKTFYGQNQNSALHLANGYVFPPECQFYCDDIINVKKLENKQYDLILLDPPWTNKYIKRKKKIKQDESYTMMVDKNLAQIPIEELLNTNGLVCVWCTNSQNHIDSLKFELFPAWNVKYVACWYWIKVTNCGEFVCNFSTPPGKQPYERIIFGRKIDYDGKLKNPAESKLLVSVPSSVHSHKPPLTEVLMPYLPSTPKCLELFARYLLPNWTSYGLEALKFQHQFLFENSDIEHCIKESKINV